MKSHRYQVVLGLLMSLLLLCEAGCRTIRDGYPYLSGLGELTWSDDSLSEDWKHAQTSTKKKSWSTRKARQEEEERNDRFVSTVDRRFYPFEYYGGPTSPYWTLFERSAERSPLLDLDPNQTDLAHSVVPRPLQSDPEMDSLLCGMRKGNSVAEAKSSGPIVGADAGSRMGVAVLPLPRDASNPIRPVGYIDAARTDDANSHSAEREANWEEQTRKAIIALRSRLEDKDRKGTLTASEQAKLRLLCLTVDEEGEASPGALAGNDSLTRFWEEQCRGLNAVLHGEVLDSPTDSQGAEAAAVHFQRGLDSLRENCPLTIAKGLLVETVAPFGLYEKKETPVRAGESLFVYAELENVVMKEVPEGLEMSVQCSWELRDSEGRVAIPRDEQVCQSISETRLRDIVLNISVETKRDLAPGRYSLTLDVVDRNSSKPEPAQVIVPVLIEKTAETRSPLMVGTRPVGATR